MSEDSNKHAECLHDMQEIDLFDEGSTDEADTDSDFLDLSCMKLYDFEPTWKRCSPSSSSSCSSVVSLDNQELKTSHIDNINWCQCGKCCPMQTDEESLCCLDTNEIPENYFKGIELVSIQTFFF